MMSKTLAPRIDYP
jgi:hypothetical protein